MRRSTKITAPVLAAAALLAMSGCAAANAPAPSASGSDVPLTTVNFTVYPAATPSQGIFIADAEGFFAKQGIKPHYVSVGTGSSSLQVLAAGQTDFTILDLTAVATSRAAGSNIVFASGQETKFAAELACQSGLSVNDTSYPGNMKALIGKSIGITGVGAATDTYTRYSLIAAGVDPSKVKIVPLGGLPQLLAGLQSKAVDCVTAYEPLQTHLPAGTISLLNWAAGDGPSEFKDYLFNGIATTETYAAAHPDIVKKVKAALQEASDYGNNPANAADIAKKTLQFYTGTDLATLTAVAKGMAGTFGANITQTQVDNAAKVYKAVYGKDFPSTYAQLIAAPVR